MPSANNDMTGFLLTHDLIRRGIPELGHRLGQVEANDSDGVRRLVDWWRVFTAILDRHHEVEDRLVWPVALAAAPGLAAAVAEIEDQHAGLDGQLAAIGAALQPLAAGTVTDWAGGVAAARAAIAAFDVAMARHLLLEEQTMVPVLEHDVSVGAFAELGAQLARDHSPDSIATEMPMVVDQAGPDQRAVMLARMPEPVRRQFVEVWEPRYRAMVDALPGTGVPAR